LVVRAGSGVNTWLVPPVKSTLNSEGIFKLLPATVHISWQIFESSSFGENTAALL